MINDVDHLIKYTDYAGPKDPDNGYQIVVKYLHKVPGTKTLDLGTIGHLEYSVKHASFCYHRDNGEPAIIVPTGTKMWCVEGAYHRIGGPAIEVADIDIPKFISVMPNGSKYLWAIHDKVFKEEEYWMNILNRDDCIR
jgi:hypothetical protein